jgi:hypothetical protein
LPKTHGVAAVGQPAERPFGDSGPGVFRSCYRVVGVCILPDVRYSGDCRIFRRSKSQHSSRWLRQRERRSGSAREEGRLSFTPNQAGDRAGLAACFERFRLSRRTSFWREHSCTLCFFTLLVESFAERKQGAPRQRCRSQAGKFLGRQIAGLQSEGLILCRSSSFRRTILAGT